MRNTATICPCALTASNPSTLRLEVAKKTGCLVAPPFRYGICNATRNFAGTITIEFDTFYKIVNEILSELVRNGFHRIIVLSGHAGNSHMVALRMAAQDIVIKNDASKAKRKTRIMVFSDFDFAKELTPKYASEKDGHAGTLETSRVMAIKPELIKAKGDTQVWQKCPVLRLLRILNSIFQAESTATQQRHLQKRDKK